jgi:hypothetical protein
VNGSSMFVDAGGAGYEQHDRAATQLNAHAAREGTGFGVIVGLVEDATIGDGALRNRFGGRLLRRFFGDSHWYPPTKCHSETGSALAPGTDARRNFENSASAVHEAIFTAAFVSFTPQTVPPDMLSQRASLESDPDFVLWHSRNGSHI